MDRAIKDQIIFVLEDDNEVMRSALDSDLDAKNKRLNRKLIVHHEKILGKVEQGLPLSQLDLLLIENANDIHLNDAANLAGHHRQALRLERWVLGRLGNCLNSYPEKY